MCGRYTITVSIEELMQRFIVDQPAPFYQPRYNAAPGQRIPAIINDGTRNQLVQFRWGLIPFWAKSANAGYKMINARVETLAEKSTYRVPFQRKRCIIPADGFYEWKETDEGKQPLRFVLKSGELFAMAGLFDSWEDPESGQKITSCTIITTGPNKVMEGVHDRMPILLRKADEAVWLDSYIYDTERLQELLERPYPGEDMEAYPVTKAVGSVKQDTPDNIKNISLA